MFKCFTKNSEHKEENKSKCSFRNKIVRVNFIDVHHSHLFNQPNHEKNIENGENGNHDESKIVEIYWVKGKVQELKCVSAVK